MKMSLMKTLFPKIAMAGLAALMPFSFALHAAAGEPTDIESLSAFRVKFISGDNEEMLFDVKYSNKEKTDFKLVVLDDTGEALFEDSYSKDLDKKLSVPRMTDSEHVVFLLKSRKENAEFTFKVKITTRVDDAASTLSR